MPVPKNVVNRPPERGQVTHVHPQGDPIKTITRVTLPAPLNLDTFLRAVRSRQEIGLMTTKVVVSKQVALVAAEIISSENTGLMGEYQSAPQLILNQASAPGDWWLE